MTVAATASTTLAGRLGEWAGNDPLRIALHCTVEALARSAIELSTLVRTTGNHRNDEPVGTNSDGDRQRPIDVLAHELVMRGLQRAPVAAVASEESDRVEVLSTRAPLVVAVDPLDGSANLAINAPVGLIFSVRAAGMARSESGFTTNDGTSQLAAGFVVFGPSTSLLLTVGDGTDLYALDESSSAFCLQRPGLRIPDGTREFAINTSNARHWYEPTRAYVDDLLEGADGPRRADFNMRWYGALVAEALRIILRGGVFLYPADSRPGYRRGRLRLLYEAHPIAMLVEQAGGAATDGVRRILELIPTGLHERTPLVFGSADKVARVARYASSFDGRPEPAERSPLFGNRGLFRT